MLTKTSGKNKMVLFINQKKYLLIACTIEKTTKGNNERKNKTG
jgi:hypothetical protein